LATPQSENVQEEAFIGVVGKTKGLLVRRRWVEKGHQPQQGGKLKKKGKSVDATGRQAKSKEETGTKTKLRNDGGTKPSKGGGGPGKTTRCDQQWLKFGRSSTCHVGMNVERLKKGLRKKRVTLKNRPTGVD